MTLRNAIRLCSVALRMDGTRLRTLVALLFRKPDFPANLECIESRTKYTVSVKIDFAAVRRLNETMVLFRHYRRDSAMSRPCLCFHVAPSGSGVIFELPDRSVERIANCNIHVLVRVLIMMLAAYRQFIARCRYVDAYVIEVAFMMMVVFGVHDDATTHNMMVKLIQLFRLLADLRLNGVGMWQSPKSDL